MDAATVAPSGGCARGVSAERFETPLAGGAAASMCASAFGWHIACQRRGGNPPAPAFPRRGKRERGRSDFLAAAGSSSWRGADRRHAAGVFALLPPFPPDSDHQPICRLCRSARFAFPEVLLAPPTPLPCFYSHSKWAALGPVQVGVRSQAQVHHYRDGPGLLGAAIYATISEGP